MKVAMLHSLRLKYYLVMGLLFLMPMHAYGATVVSPTLDTGDTAWMLISATLVLLMTIPGLALFYAGMVRKKNVLATMMQSFSICCMITILWIVIGYSLVFTTGTPFLGNLSQVMLHGILDHYHLGVDKGFVLGADTASPAAMTIPQSVFVVFQMTFIIISVAILVGSAAERIKFSALCVFCLLWALLSYVPIAHWVWSPAGWIAALGAIDFAGGTVVHINAGVAGLVCAVLNSGQLQAGQTCAIIGLGGVGLAALLGALAAGAETLIAIDINEEKRKIALELGAEYVIDPSAPDAIEQIHHIVPDGVDLAVELAGAVPALKFAYDITKRGGQTVTAGLPHPKAELSFPAVSLTTEEKTLKGSYVGSCVPLRDIPRFARMMVKKQLPVEKLITHHIRLEDINEGFERLASGEGIRQLIIF